MTKKTVDLNQYHPIISMVVRILEPYKFIPESINDISGIRPNVIILRGGVFRYLINIHSYENEYNVTISKRTYTYLANQEYLTLQTKKGDISINIHDLPNPKGTTLNDICEAIEQFLIYHRLELARSTLRTYASKIPDDQLAERVIEIAGKCSASYVKSTIKFLQETENAIESIRQKAKELNQEKLHG